MLEKRFKVRLHRCPILLKALLSLLSDPFIVDEAGYTMSQHRVTAIRLSIRTMVKCLAHVFASIEWVVARVGRIKCDLEHTILDTAPGLHVEAFVRHNRNSMFRDEMVERIDICAITSLQ